MTAATLDEVVAALERLYPPERADDWDRVGLVVGDPAAEVSRVLLAVDPVQAVVDQALRLRADLVVTHHPLLLRPVSSVRADRPKGRVVHDLISHGVGLYVAHTNADSPRRGVSESLAAAIALVDVVPLRPEPSEPLDKIVTFVPAADVQRVIDALAGAGAGAIGAYDRCAFTSVGEGTFRPGPEASPAIGRAGVIEVVAESRVEMVLARRHREAVVAALRGAHPYEEPAFDVIELAPSSSHRGAGRLGSLASPMSLADFASRVVASVPGTAVGARVSGDLAREVRRVAVAGGAGDFLLDDARAAGADVYVTSDLRHHPASELREHPDAPALVDIPHWAAEWTWLPVLRDVLAAALAESGRTVDTVVSEVCTDPWNHHAQVPSLGGPPDR
jgi:dinuclear metal center YbgI/SA1388 family protein